ncbi:TraB/GumN family protein [Spirochaeta lutea]|uniref:TraB/GumN family protein n=1 Tax=Spirochaeta lutea TaxID=1480694 RepID=UPI000A962C44
MDQQVNETEPVEAVESPNTSEPQDSDTITRVSLGGREYTIIGTAHISSESVREVDERIREENPHRVCVELDQGRYNALVNGQNWQNLDIFKVIKEKKAFLLLGNLVLSASQKRMGMDLGIKPGQEMKAAISTAEELGIPVSLCDREIQTTLRRAWGLSGFWGKNKLLASLIAGAFSTEKLSNEDLEKMKQKSALHGMLEEVAEYLPSAKRVLIDERDEYLAKKIFESPGEAETRILAVVGAGHVPGILRHLEALHAKTQTPDVSEIDFVPPPSRVGKLIPWIISGVIIGLIVWGFISGGVSQGLENFGVWVLVNGGLAALGALAALGHPLTVVLSFAAAPLTSLNPTIGVGFVSAFIEAWVRKPRVRDFESLQTDILSFRGFYRNRITRTLLVFLFATLGSAVGTFIGIPLLIPG